MPSAIARSQSSKLRQRSSGYAPERVADAPGRHEPGTGEINYTKVLAHLEKCGYTGRVGYELFPETDTATAVKAIMEHSPKA